MQLLQTDFANDKQILIYFRWYNIAKSAFNIIGHWTMNVYTDMIVLHMHNEMLIWLILKCIAITLLSTFIIHVLCKLYSYSYNYYCKLKSWNRKKISIPFLIFWFNYTGQDQSHQDYLCKQIISFLWQAIVQ